MTKTFFAADTHFSHRAILAFSPTRIKTLGLDNKYSEFEIAHNYRVLKDDQTDRETKRLVKVFFESVVSDMNKAIIDQWNAAVGFSDVVYILGDVSFGRREETEKFLDRMHGRLHLVRGNHDKGTDELARFEWVKDYHKGHVNGQTIVMMHYQIMEFDGQHRGNWHVHGHQHSNGPKHQGKVLDCGMEQLGKIAIEFNELKTIMDQKPVTPHGNSEENIR